MKIHRNVLTVVAATLLAASSLPASAQLLGGGLGGGAGGMLGGAIGPGAMTGNGGANGDITGGITGNTGLRDRVGQASARTREGVGSASTAARGRVEAAKQSASTTSGSAAETASTSGKNAAASAPGGGALSLGGAGNLEKSVGNRTVSGSGNAKGNAEAKPGQFNAGADGSGAASVKKNEPSPAEPGVAATPAR